MRIPFINDPSLQQENRALKLEINAFRKGEKYQSLKETHARILAEKDREISRLKQELSDAHAETVKVRNLWFEECEEIIRKSESAMAKLTSKVETLENERWDIIRKHDEKIAEMEKEHSKQLAEKEAVILELEQKLAHAEALLAHDGTNTGLPTSLTPPGKKKVIPNTRRSTGKPKGGQAGHQKHTKQMPPEKEIDETIPHELEEGEVCPECFSKNYRYTGRYESTYEHDYVIKEVWRRHDYYIYECLDCGTEFRTGKSPDQMGVCQYGPMTRATILSLTNTVNAAMNKTVTFLMGITGGAIHPSDSYVAKQQRKAYEALEAYEKDVYKKVILLKLIYWDDTVITIGKEKGCLRFYGDEKIAYFTAHKQKNMEGLDEDNVLNVLGKDTKVMHDHNKVNYNDKYQYENLECDEHLLRDLKKSANDTGHPELLELKELISETIGEKKNLEETGEESFSEEHIIQFTKKVTEILERAERKNRSDYSRYFGREEKNLIARVRKYFHNYFAWLWDFTLPTTNNTSERALRCAKSHMKVSGKFENVKNAKYYARIKSYIETGRRNGMNEIDLLRRLMEGNPYTLDEIINFGNKS